jgi:hypothetical protein
MKRVHRHGETVEVRARSLGRILSYGLAVAGAVLAAILLWPTGSWSFVRVLVIAIDVGIVLTNLWWAVAYLGSVGRVGCFAADVQRTWTARRRSHRRAERVADSDPRDQQMTRLEGLEPSSH